MTLKNILITLSIVAVVMVAITSYVVFASGGGTYVVNSSSDDGGIFSTSTLGEATATVSSTASSTSLSSSTLALASSSSATSTTMASTTPGSTANGATPITWTQGNETMSVTGAQVSGAQLTLDVQVVMGSVPECVPLTLRLIADENGDLAPPVTQQFTFPDTGTCTGTPGETYAAQQVVFTLPTPGTFPILLTTGGAANILFEVVQNPDQSLSLELPPQTD